MLNLLKLFTKKPEVTIEPLTEQPLTDLPMRGVASSFGEKNLTNDERVVVLDQLANFEPLQDIVKYVGENFKKSIAYKTLCNYQKTYRDIITQKREAFQKRFMDEQFANKRERIIGFQELYKISFRKEDVKNASMQLAQVREEVEGGRKDTVFNTMITQFNNMTDGQLKQRKKELDQLIEEDT